MGTVLTVRDGSATVGFTVRRNTTDVLNVHTQYIASCCAVLCCAALSAVSSLLLSAAVCCCLPITYHSDNDNMIFDY